MYLPEKQGRMRKTHRERRKEIVRPRDEIVCRRRRKGEKDKTEEKKRGKGQQGQIMKENEEKAEEEKVEVKKL